MFECHLDLLSPLCWPAVGRAEDGSFRVGKEESPWDVRTVVVPGISCKAGGHSSAMFWLRLCLLSSTTGQTKGVCLGGEVSVKEKRENKRKTHLYISLKDEVES